MRYLASGVLCVVVLAAGCATGSASGAGSAEPAVSAPAAPAGTTDVRVVQPGAPGEASRTVNAGDLDAAPTYTAADVQFMQGMISHHAQALEMTELLETRTARDDMKLLAQRIDISQADEIGMMQKWLAARGQDVTNIHAHHMSGMLMPGMLTPDDMAKLAAASGAEFDRLFLEYMIRHHEGALVMVRDLFAQAGAGQQGEVFAFASDVEADQSIEIRRMRAMLAAGGGGVAPGFRS